MAENINPKDAKELIAKHQALIKTAHSATSAAEALKRSLVQEINNAIDAGQIERILVRELYSELGYTRQTLPDHILRLLHTWAALYEKYLFLINSKANNEAQIDLYIKQLSSVTTLVKRLFSSASVKEDANNAYRQLSGYFSTSYEKDIKDAAARINALCRNNTTLPQVRSQQLQAAMQALQKDRRPILFPQAQEAVNLLSKLDSAIAVAQNQNKAARENVEPAAKKLAEHLAFKAIQEIPVEELNRGKKGIRVKALRDAGYENIADITTATFWDLARCNGISEPAAQEIKAIANEITANAIQSTKVRLSADEKTQESSRLVYEVYKAKQYGAFCAELQALKKQLKATVVPLSTFLNAQDVFCWLLEDEAQRQPVHEATKKLGEALQDQDCARVNEVATQLYNFNANQSDAWNDFANNSAAFFNIIEELAPDLLGNSDTLYGLPEELAREIQDECFFPDGLTCTLRRYQEWGVKYILHQERTLLGDEMGLGKTVQAIAAMVSLKNTGATHFVVICPASVLTNWCREIAKHSKLRHTKIHGSDRAYAFNSWKTAGGVAVTTYETTNAIDFSTQPHLDMVIVDEAHYIKNPEARRTINVKKVCNNARYLLFMTGTALENKVDEMISLIGILRPEMVRKLQGMSFMVNAPQFREAVAPVYYRRKREDVLTELPELIEKHEWCTLYPEEEAVYEKAVLAKKYAQARRVSWTAPDLARSSKAERLLSICNEAKEDKRKIIVFTYFLETLKSVASLLSDRCVGYISGSVSVARRQEIIDSFEKAPDGAVLVAQIQAGGTGLNIQAASVVVLCEPQFKPSIENQAISRAYRMGQSRNVFVHRLLCEDTVDERLLQRLMDKQQIFDAFADKSVAAKQVEEIDDTTFGQIIEEEIERIKVKHGIKDVAVGEGVSATDASKQAVPEQDVETEQIAFEPISLPQSDQSSVLAVETAPDTAFETVFENVPETVPATVQKETVPTINFCIQCGSKVVPGAKFCFNCGQSLTF